MAILSLCLGPFNVTRLSAQSSNWLYLTLYETNHGPRTKLVYLPGTNAWWPALGISNTTWIPYVAGESNGAVLLWNGTAWISSGLVTSNFYSYVTNIYNSGSTNIEYNYNYTTNITITVTNNTNTVIIDTTYPLVGGPLTNSGAISITYASPVSDGAITSTNYNDWQAKEPAIASGSPTNVYYGDKIARPMQWTNVANKPTGTTGWLLQSSNGTDYVDSNVQHTSTNTMVWGALGIGRIPTSTFEVQGNSATYGTGYYSGDLQIQGKSALNGGLRIFLPSATSNNVFTATNASGDGIWKRLDSNMVDGVQQTLPTGNSNQFLNGLTQLKEIRHDNISEAFSLYGAKGDGVTDDTAALQAALTALGYLDLPAGRTFLSGQLVITKPYTRISGIGGYAVIKAKNSCNADLLFVDGTAAAIYAKIDNLIIDGNDANNTTGNGILLRNAAYTQVSQCIIYNCAESGIKIQNYGGSSLADEINIIDNKLFANHDNGLIFSDTGWNGDHLIKDNHINYNGDDGIVGYYVTATLFKDNNVLSNGRYGIYIRNPMRCVFAGNEIRNNGSTGLRMTKITYAHDNLVANNQLHYNHDQNADIWYQERLVLSGNYFGDSDFTARTAYGLQLYTCNNAQLLGNIFQGTNLPALIWGGTTYNARANYGVADYYKALDTLAIGTVNDSEGKSTRYTMRVEPALLGSSEQAAGIYMNVAPGGSNQVYGMFIDYTNNVDAFGSAITIKNWSPGDAVYEALMLNGGVAMESASFANGTKGIISTLQTADCFYTTLFNGLWGQDTVPGYGAFYCDLIPGNSFVARRRNGASTNNLQFKVTDESLVDIAGIRNDGGYCFPDGTVQWTAASNSVANLSGTTGKLVKFTGSTTGGDSVISEKSGKLGLNMSTDPTYWLQFDNSTAGNDQLCLYRLPGDAYQWTGIGARTERTFAFNVPLGGAYEFTFGSSGTSGAIMLISPGDIYAAGNIHSRYLQVDNTITVGTSVGITTNFTTTNPITWQINGGIITGVSY